MARYTGPKSRIARKFGEGIFGADKVLSKKNYPPGQHGLSLIHIFSQFVDPSINVAIEDGHVMLTENENEMLDNIKQRHAFHGLYRSLVNNMVIGDSEGYKKELELVGVG